MHSSGKRIVTSANVTLRNQFPLRLQLHQYLTVIEFNNSLSDYELTLSSRLLSKNLKTKIYKTIILPVVLYGCETWSLTLREECRLRVFENRILNPIFGPKKNENGEWRRLHN